jgi:acetate kinase
MSSKREQSHRHRSLFGKPRLSGPIAKLKVATARASVESGLRGISGISTDLREILAARDQGNARAQLAFDAYVHSLRCHIGAMLASLGGLDALVFAAGIGEHAAPVRAAACEAFGFLGLKLDPERNAQSRSDWDIAAPDSAVRVLVIHTQEDWEIARECWKLTHS